MIARILVCGSRDWKDRAAIRRALAAFEPGDVVIHGGQRSGDVPPYYGADYLAGEVAVELRLTVEVYPADWNKYGKGAGPLRNQLMIDSKPHCVIAFPLPESRGTWDTIRRAQAANIPVFLADGRGDALLGFARQRT